MTITQLEPSKSHSMGGACLGFNQRISFYQNQPKTPNIKVQLGNVQFERGHYKWKIDQTTFNNRLKVGRLAIRERNKL